MRQYSYCWQACVQRGFMGSMVYAIRQPADDGNIIRRKLLHEFLANGFSIIGSTPGTYYSKQTGDIKVTVAFIKQ